MSFFNKVKQGASEAAKKAQQTVEITKLKAQMSGKEKDMDKLYHQIGEAVYRAKLAGSIADSEQEVAACCEQLDYIVADLRMLEERIKNIRYEKSCTCGKVVPLDARFCPDCGAQLAEEPKPETTVGEIRVICSHCLTENELNAKFCLTCGNTLSSGHDAPEAPDMPDDGSNRAL
ncbi:zinc ribbon domain-containing protein [Paenibacillus humicola]|uniref:zinc ribbon domain-containing protein n=1 Tax=Paenibacillus humicola TaxID=3110540 RepID=UPI00237A1FBF|nr:zinc ribbon domain-containing protein [Paenibacillus humicola]